MRLTLSRRKSAPSSHKRFISVVLVVVFFCSNPASCWHVAHAAWASLMDFSHRSWRQSVWLIVQPLPSLLKTFLCSLVWIFCFLLAVASKLIKSKLITSFILLYVDTVQFVAKKKTSLPIIYSRTRIFVALLLIIASQVEARWPLAALMCLWRSLQRFVICPARSKNPSWTLRGMCVCLTARADKIRSTVAGQLLCPTC